jgi:5,10-methylenetetrahydromethanopterin reductase
MNSDEIVRIQPLRFTKEKHYKLKYKRESHMNHSSRRVEFGIRIPPSESPHKLGEAAQVAEDGGFDCVWIPDSHMFFNEVFINLSVVALHTKHVKLGPAVCVPFTRHPTVVASSIATLNLVSKGRAVLGYGSGASALAQIGLRPFASLAQVRRDVTIIKDLLHGKIVELNGKQNRLSNADSSIPIYLAATGPKMLQLAGEIADGVIINVGIGDENLHFAFDNIENGAKRSGKKLEDLKILCVVHASPDIVSDKTVALRKFKPICTYWYNSPELLKAVGIRMDDRILALFRKPVTYPDTTHAKDLEQAMAAASAVPDEIVEKFVLFGDGPQIVERITRMFEMGIAHVIVRHYSSHSLPYDLIKLYSEQVIPNFRENR